ncbi:phosphotransferase [Paenibacillus abyssi]|uniref:Aminoglycoside phosphotransferase domain-containing protein n=1 Tax=Paenibacillus abyssi TaxID=1340531 RepID=A0A917CV89_9BACL|nr:phosphotransferase [Paenibacillus abyssi]GGF98729.1 hypothetical protein GCM10010916_14990 [Paenibacillus abyssi]
MSSEEKAMAVLKLYFGNKQPRIRWLQNEPDKSVWKVTVDHNKYVLKCSKKHRKAPIFSILLQHELSQKGLPTPAVIPTINKEVFVEDQSYHYFLTEYVKGSTASIKERTKIIGDFHREAVLPRSLSMYRSKLVQVEHKSDWIAEYEYKLRCLKMWMGKYALPRDMRHCINMAEKCISISKRATLLDEHIDEVNRKNLLTHGDFYSSNVLKSKKGKLWIIDFERSGIDSPVKDLRFIMPDIILSSYYETYFSRYPQGKRYEQIYYMDALFPHRLFTKLYILIRKKKARRNLDQIKDIIGLELEKERMIGELRKYQ